MIRTYQPADLDRLMQLWLQGNLQAHPFVPASYWEENAPDVRQQLPQARLFLYEDAQGVQGFLGLVDGYIAGIFVDAAARSKGIGHALIERAKQTEQKLTLQVYLQNERACVFPGGEAWGKAEGAPPRPPDKVELELFGKRKKTPRDAPRDFFRWFTDKIPVPCGAP